MFIGIRSLEPYCNHINWILSSGYDSSMGILCEEHRHKAQDKVLILNIRREDSHTIESKVN